MTLPTTPITDNSIIEVPLTQCKFGLIDAVDRDLLNRRWYAVWDDHSKTFYVKSGGQVRLHRVILERVLGRPLATNELPDHINHDGLDNRRCNLRLATRSQNAINTRLTTRNTSGFKGVYWHKPSKKYRATIKVNDRRIYLGSFVDPAVAYQAYCEAAERYFGEFARCA